MKATIRCTLAQLNLLVGDIDHNIGRIINSIETAAHKKSDLIIFSELALTGYPLEDLLEQKSLRQQVISGLSKLKTYSHQIAILVGHPLWENENCYNSCSLLYAGKQITYCKHHLPNYGVFDEKRYFSPGDTAGIMTLHGHRLAISICEDLWHEDSIKNAIAQKAKLLININASPYHINKQKERKILLQQCSKKGRLPIIYVNAIGGQDELVFDGGSMAINADSTWAYQAPRFIESLNTVTWDTNTNQIYTTGKIDTTIGADKTEEIYQALTLGLRDYVQKNHFPGVLVGLSGGIDSALTLCLAADALTPEQVQGLILPSRYNAKISAIDAKAQAKSLGITTHIMSIERPFVALSETLKPIIKNLSNQYTEENLQARCRGILLMAVSNYTGQLLLTTSNKSEFAVGYATLYGDMAGGFAPLKDITKTMVYRLANWRNQSKEVIPKRILERPPSAELRPNQRDDDSLPPYEILDPILTGYIEENQSAEELCNAGFSKSTIMQVVDMIYHSEYKRQQAPPGTKITKHAFGKDHRYPISSNYRDKVDN